MAEFKLGRIRFVWKNDWASSTIYYKDDVVAVGGKIYICVIGHTSSADFYSDFDIVPPKWNLVSDGQTWKGNWSPNTDYKYDDIVKYGSRLYIANTNHTSANITGTKTYTVTVAANTESPFNNVYLLDGEQYPDIQFEAGYTYIFNQDSATNNTHYLLLSTTKNGTHGGGSEYTNGVSYFLDGAEVADSATYIAGFDAATTREIRITVSSTTPDPLYYYCYSHSNMAINSQIDVGLFGLTDNASNWDIFGEGVEWKANWVPGFKYKVNDFVRYGGITYICNEAHTAASTYADGLEVDQSKWNAVNEGIEFKNIWASGTRYKVNDLVTYGAGVYICSTAHTAGATFVGDSANWTKFVEGLQYEGEWLYDRGYQPGDIVQYGGYQYISKTDHQDSIPPDNTDDWDLFSEGIKFLGEWGDDSTNFEHKVGELVTHGAYTYICIADHQNQEPPNATYWKQLNSGLRWRGAWLDDQEYLLGDVARYGDNSYVCIQQHFSEGDDFSSIQTQPGGGGNANSRPDLDTTGTYWQIIAVGSEQSVLTTTGDLVYYSANGPTRLPIGQNGQILSVSADNIPEWTFLGSTDDVYYVAEHGQDLPAPIYGKTIDRPFKSIRYAAQQVDRGTHNPDAAKLLRLNRRWIQREIVEWTDYQIANNISPFTTAFDYDSNKCERDMGLIVDAVIWDITHGGNVRSREAALSYVNDTVGSPYLTQKTETVASIEYGLSLIQNVLNQSAPSTDYQVTNGDNSTAIVAQYVDASLTAENGVYNDISSLVGIITDAITAGDADNIPARDIRNTLIKVNTGKFVEVLPIIVPAECCIIGDELRSTNVQPRTALNTTLTPKSDFKYSYVGLDRMASIIGDVVGGITVTPTTGNTQLQDTSWPTAETTAVQTEVQRLARSIKERADIGLGTKELGTLKPVYDLTDPNYGYSRDLFLQNKEFIQAEIVAYITENFPNVSYSRTKCKQDVGFIMDAVAYDLTYGGNWQTQNAGLAYYAGASGALQIDSEELTATVSAYGRLKELLQTVGRNITVNPVLQTDVEQIPGIGGSATVSTTIGTLMDDFVDIVENGTGQASITYPSTAGVDAALVSDSTDLAAAKDDIGVATIDFISKNFGSFRYNSAKCRRDLDLIITDTSYDTAIGTNFNAVYTGIAYKRPNNAYNLINQRTETVGAIRYARDEIIDALSDSTAITRTRAAYNEIVDIINNGTTGTAAPGDGVADTLTFPNPGSVVQDKIDAKDNLQANVDFIKADVIAYIANNYPSLVYNQTKCERDVGYIIDALCYDIMYSSDQASQRVAESYFVDGVNQVSDQNTETIAAYEHLKTIAQAIVQENSVTAQSGNAEVQTTLGSPASATEATEVGTLMDLTIDSLTAGNTNSLPAITYPNLASLGVSGTLQTEKTAIDNAEADTITATIQYINTTYNDFKYDQAKCTRDLGLLIDAARYDWMLGTNMATLMAALSYLRQPSAKIIGNQKDATIAANEFARVQAYTYLSEAVAQNGLNDSWQIIQDTIWHGSAEGGNRAVADQDVWNAIRHLELNQEFIVEEVLAYVDEYFKDTVIATNDSDNSFSISDTSWLDRNMPIKFQEFADSTSALDAQLLDENTTYYVRDILSATRFTISETIGGTEFVLAGGTNTFSVMKAYEYNRTLCARDVREYINAMMWDLEWPQEWKREYTDNITIYRTGVYKSRLGARYYVNSVIGSQEEDMYYLRNGTGLRLQTLDGLRGDLSSNNEFGTKRPTAGAYASLDPGWGPDDQRVWISARSPYVQNLTTFGFAAVGQKIDGALHNGGNDSIVSNDFTQVISDGIGAWITNNGRAELVSVFTYYSHIGYLAENGGRVRATNGNNSYGTFGSVAEGVDPDETPVTAVVDNSTQYNATIGNVYTDTDQLLRLEYSHAGNDYTDAVINIFGPGDGEVLVIDEFRDETVNQVRVVETTPDTAGGSGYTVVSNTAQTGGASFIDLAATDGNLSTAYPGMKIYITGGAGTGLFGIIDTYNSGSKRATVIRESDGGAGWDHAVPGTAIVTPNSSSTYQIEPRIELTAPTRSIIDATTGLNSTNSANIVKYCETSNNFTGLGVTTDSDGRNATFDVIRNGSKYYVTINTGGIDYRRLDTLTILGTDLDGASPANDITITVTTVNADTGAVVDFDFSGIGLAGSYIAVGDSNGAWKSEDGDTFSSVTIGTGNHSDVTSGLQDDGSSTYAPSVTVVAMGNGSQNILYSTDNTTWNTVNAGLNGGSSDQAVAFGNVVGADINRIVLVSPNTNNHAYSDNGGVTWTIASASLPGTGYSEVEYGMGLWVAVETGGTGAAYSTDGIAWTSATLPGNAVGGPGTLAFGDGIWVCLGGTGYMYSIDGINWTDASSNPFATTSQIAYGQGIFVVTDSTTNNVKWSDDGITWNTLATNVTSAGGYSAVAFGNPNRVGNWVIKSEGAVAGQLGKIGAQARARVAVANEQIFEVRLTEPGSGYTSDPTITVTDPNNIDDVELTVRRNSGALANPTFVNRGSSFISASAEVEGASSNGSADFFQDGQYIAVRRLTERPVAGSNIEFASLPGQFFKLVNSISFLGSNDGSYTAFLQISPVMTITDAPVDGDAVEMRIRFSQVRLTGHDFLDIGTGNFADTNYPGVPVNDPDQANETVDSDGGRVFFTATDQDGNFRVGDLFNIEQATGVATLNADAFNIAGLQELTLGEVTLGGNSASVTEFSTDPFFTANSDSVVPTQRAVKAYIEAQIGGGGATLNVNSVTAGDIFINTNQITTVSGEQINIKANVNFSGQVLGLPIAYNYFLR